MSDRQLVLLAARHGTTTLNANGCFRGDANPPLNAQGHKEAEESGEQLSTVSIGSIYTSPRQRATQTADRILKHLSENKCYQEIDDLAALDVGEFSGQPKSPENVEKIEHYIDNPDVPIPDGESLNDFRTRVRPLFHEALKIYEASGLPCLFVVHSSIIHELGQVFNDDHHSARVEPGGIAAVYFEDGKFHAEPIFKPLKVAKNKADTVS